MTAPPEDFALRLTQLEREFQELSARVSTSPPHALPDLADQISLRAWLKISAPTFAVLLVGFTLLWNAQQVTSAHLLEMSRSLGRFDGAVVRLESSIAGLDERMVSFDQRLASFDERLAGIDTRLAGIDERLLGIDERLIGIDERLVGLDERFSAFDASVLKLGDAIDRLANRP